MIKDNRMLCDSCFTEVQFFPKPEKWRQNSPMLKTRVWKKALKNLGLKYTDENGQFLCDSCMSVGLKRKLRLKDLRKCPLSDDYVAENSEYFN